jgi:hypothetical protein
MNKQRNVIYGKENHSLFGERLALDLIIFSSVAAEGLLVASFKEITTTKVLSWSVILNFGMEPTE